MIVVLDQQGLKSVEFGVAQGRALALRERPQDQVRLAEAAPPGAEGDPAQPLLVTFGFGTRVVIGHKNPCPVQSFDSGAPDSVPVGVSPAQRRTVLMLSSMRPEILFPLFAEVTSLKGVGPKVAPLVQKLAGPLVRDVLFLAPAGLITRRRTTAADAVEGEVGDLRRHRRPPDRARPSRARR